MDGPFEAGRAIPVSYMSSSNPTPKVRKFITHRSLLIAEESPVSHPPSYCGSNSASYPEGNSRDCSAGNPVRNPESYLVCYSVSNRASYLERNSASCSESCLGRNPAESSSGYPENRRASNPQSNLPSNGAENLLSYSESCPADSSASCLGSFGRSPDANPACRAAIRFCSPLPTPYPQLPPVLPRDHDLADTSLVPRPSGPMASTALVNMGRLGNMAMPCGVFQ